MKSFLRAAYFSTFLMLSLGTIPVQAANYYMPRVIHQEMDKLWPPLKQNLIDNLSAALTQKNTEALYYTQANLFNLAHYARLADDRAYLNDAAEVCLTAYPYLQTVNGHSQWVCGDSLHPCSVPSRQGQEVLLFSGQWVYLLSEITNGIASVPPSRRTPSMNKFLASYVNVIQDHLNEWIFGQDASRLRSYAGWSCLDQGTYNESTFIDKQAQHAFGFHPSYCDAVEVVQTEIMGAAANILSANRADGTAVPLSSAQFAQFSDYAQRAAQLLASRFSSTSLTDPKGKPATGAVFQLNVWKDHPDFKDAGDSDPNVVPTPTSVYLPPTVSEDFSHFRNDLRAVRSLYEARAIIGSTAINPPLLKALSDQVAYGTFNGNLKKPTFSNFTDREGWYRLHYAPGGLSAAFPTGGYIFWTEYGNPLFPRMANVLWNLFNTNDPNALPFLNQYYFKDYPDATSQAFCRLMFYSSNVFPKQSNGGNGHVLSFLVSPEASNEPVLTVNVSPLIEDVQIALPANLGFVPLNKDSVGTLDGNPIFALGSPNEDGFLSVHLNKVRPAGALAPSQSGQKTVQLVLRDLWGDQTTMTEAFPEAAFETVSNDLSHSRAYPNPWRVDQHNTLPLTFDNLPEGSTVKIFTVSGHWVKTLEAPGGSASWDLTNDSGEKVASGLYIYSMSTQSSQKKNGTLAIIE